MRIASLFFIVLMLTGCPAWQTMTDEAYNRQAINLRRLGNAVQGELWRGAAQDDDLLALACERDPALCEPFEPNSVLVSVVDIDVALLLCNAKRTRAIIEDAPCTPETDRRAWEEEKTPCVFTLDVAKICAD